MLRRQTRKYCEGKFFGKNSRSRSPFPLPCLFPGQAFTLIEILVVVGILGLLVALSVPAMKGMVEKGQRVRCMANLRQLGAGIMLYAADNNGRLPPAQNATPPAPGAEFWAQSPDMWARQYAAASAKDLKKIMRCPADRTLSSRDDYCSYTWAAHFLQNWVNGAPQNLNESTRYVRLYEVPNYLMMVDCVTFSPFGVDGALPPIASVAKDVISDRHQGGANALFGDGSVRWMSKADLVGNVNLYNIFNLPQ
ncbi:MAG: H-X9-DG-CTERM domain-containing protein [Verrucomicrobiota bacterium]